jgi:hypothetical protein
LTGQPYSQYIAQLQYNGQGTSLHAPHTDQKNKNYTPRVQSEKDILLLVMVFYHQNLLTYDGQDKAFVNDKTGKETYKVNLLLPNHATPLTNPDTVIN